MSACFRGISKSRLPPCKGGTLPLSYKSLLPDGDSNPNLPSHDGALCTVSVVVLIPLSQCIFIMLSGMIVQQVL